MTIGRRLFLGAGVGIFLSQAALLHGQPPPATQPPAPQPVAPGTFKDDREQASYGVGMYFGNQIKRSSMDVDFDTVLAAMKDVVNGKQPKMTEQQAQESLRTYQQEARKKAAQVNRNAATEFLAK